jgi:hypothetical protein
MLARYKEPLKLKNSGHLIVPDGVGQRLEWGIKRNSRS